MPQARGGEHWVSQDPLSGRFFKATRPEAQLGFGIAIGDYSRGATPSEYLDRAVLQNEIFFDDIWLEFIVQSSQGISIVISQPTIKGRSATPEEIGEFMELLGFEKFAPAIFYDRDRGLLLYDLYPRNVLVDEADIPHVIDPVIQRVTEDFADFIRKNPYLVDQSY